MVEQNVSLRKAQKHLILERQENSKWMIRYNLIWQLITIRDIILPAQFFQIYLIQTFFKFWKYLSCFVMVCGNHLSYLFYSLFLSLWAFLSKRSSLISHQCSIYVVLAQLGAYNLSDSIFNCKISSTFHNTW